MAQLRITIPDDEIQLVLEAYAEMRGIEPTAEMVKKEITDGIKSVVNQYRLKLMAQDMTDVEVS